jgi:hypothetical protein
VIFSLRPLQRIGMAAIPKFELKIIDKKVRLPPTSKTYFL